MDWTASAIDLKRSPASKRARVEKCIIRENQTRRKSESRRENANVRERNNEGFLCCFHGCFVLLLFGSGRGRKSTSRTTSLQDRS